MKYTRLQVFLLFIDADAGLGATHVGGKLALRAGGRRHINLAPDCQKIFQGDVLENLEKKKPSRKTIERGQKIAK